MGEDLKLEGIIAKRTDSTYRPAKRSDSWIKIKHDNNDGDLTYAGWVGTGFSEAEPTESRQKLDKLIRTTLPIDCVPCEDSSDATWVTSKLNAEVKHSGITRDHRLRHPT